MYSANFAFAILPAAYALTPGMAGICPTPEETFTNVEEGEASGANARAMLNVPRTFVSMLFHQSFSSLSRIVTGLERYPALETMTSIVPNDSEIFLKASVSDEEFV